MSDTAGLTETECTAMGSAAEEEESLVAPEDDEGSWPELGAAAPGQSEEPTAIAPNGDLVYPSWVCPPRVDQGGLCNPICL